MMQEAAARQAIHYLQSLLAGDNRNFTEAQAALVDLKTLPAWVSEAVHVYLMRLPNTEALLVVPRSQMAFDGITTAHKLISKKFKKPTILLVNQLPAKARGVLARMRIPHMSTGGGLFAPELGVVMAKSLPVIQASESDFQREKLYPFAQKLIAAHLLNDPLTQDIESLTDLQKRAARLGAHLSLSNLSRVFHQLSSVGIVNVSGLGPNKKFAFQDRTLVWSKTLELETETILKKYREHQLPDQNCKWVYSGDTALSFYSELSEGPDQIIAMSYFEYENWKKNANLKNTSLDESKSVAIEIWRADPIFLSKEKNMNIIELSLSLRRNPDPRIRLCLDEALSAVGLDAKKLWE